MYVDVMRLRSLTQTLTASAGNYRRMRNAVENGAKLLIEDRCEFIDEDTIRIQSDSGEVYLTSYGDCVNEGTGERCPAFAVGVPCKHRAAMFILRMLYEGEADGDHECSDCGKRFYIESLLPTDRTILDPGATVPSGECPLCGFYCYPYEEEAVAACLTRCRRW